jgi:hypothetical protein
VTYSDALILLYELADRQDPRFQPAAARWHARFVLEASLPLGESEMVMQMLCGIRGANRQVVRRRLLTKVESAGLATVDVPSS